MKYLCLVYHQEEVLGTLSREAAAKLDAESLAYNRSLAAKGKLVATDALQSVKTAKTVKRRNGQKFVTDGPFAETKEQLLGFVMVEADDLDEALELASHIPLAEMGQIEVRAIYDIPGS